MTRLTGHFIKTFSSLLSSTLHLCQVQFRRQNEHQEMKITMKNGRYQQHVIVLNIQSIKMMSMTKIHFFNQEQFKVTQEQNVKFAVLV